MATKKKKKANKTSRPKNKKDRRTIPRDIKGLVLLFSGIFILFFLFASNSGAVGAWISEMLKLAIGKAGYFLGILLVAAGILKMVRYSPHVEKRIFIGMSLLLLLSTLVFSLIDQQVYDSILALEQVETYRNEAMGGGIVGMVLSGIMVRLFSETGTWIFVVFLILLVLLMTIPATIQDYYQKMRQKTGQLKAEREEQRQKRKERIEAEKALKQLESSESTTKTEKSDKPLKILDYKDIRPENETIAEEEKEPESASNPSEETSIKEIPETKEEEKKEEEALSFHKSEPMAYRYPPLRLLRYNPSVQEKGQRKEVQKRADLLEATLKEFGVLAKITEVSVGPTVTRYELQPEPGVKVSKIVNLSNDIALSLATSDVRIEAPIPGKAAVGIEVPNQTSHHVYLKEIIQSSEFKSNESKLTFALGKKLTGAAVVADISKMPHLLIAGATGSGKSVCINSMIISILYKAHPDEVKMILIDPKMVELNNYNGIPHLLIPVVTDPKQASSALNWAIKEMTERYQAFKDAGVRDINGYNMQAKEKGKERMPRIVIIIDELADLMMVSPREVENAICRLAQLARAAGIHLVLATQRPSVDVITGLIKANIPSRISFSVSSQTDSRTILDTGGAEKLLGSGDMLYHPVGKSKPLRVQGAFISDEEVEQVVTHVKGGAKPEYDEQVLDEIKDGGVSVDSDDYDDDMLPKAIELAVQYGKISTSQLQRKLRLGYSRAGRLIDEMEERGIISGPQGSKPRDLLMDPLQETKQNEENGTKGE